MRISDWSSDVCSSDLPHRYGQKSGDRVEIERRPVDRVAAFSNISLQQLRHSANRFVDVAHPHCRQLGHRVAEMRKFQVEYMGSAFAIIKELLRNGDQQRGLGALQRKIDRKSTRLNYSH